MIIDYYLLINNIPKMSNVSKSIFVLENTHSYILFDYIDLCFFDKNSKAHTDLMCCFCCCFSDDYEFVQIFSNKDNYFRDSFDNWIYELSLSYIKKSGIDFTKMSLYSIECIKSTNKIKIKNNKAATVIFHFNDDKNNGYITTHKSINYTFDDRKYIVVVYDFL